MLGTSCDLQRLHAGAIDRRMECRHCIRSAYVLPFLSDDTWSRLLVGQSPSGTGVYLNQELMQHYWIGYPSHPVYFSCNKRVYPLVLSEPIPFHSLRSSSADDNALVCTGTSVQPTESRVSYIVLRGLGDFALWLFYFTRTRRAFSSVARSQ